ncbi:PilN family type IVB pilus formation outer membrane protein [Xanthomonas euvesicatoria]
MRMFLAALAVTALAGCSTMKQQQDTAFSDANAAVDGAFTSIRNGGPVGDGPVRVLNNETYVPSAVTPAVADKLLPVSCSIRYAPKGGASWDSFAREVTNLCNVPVRITSDAYAAIRGEAGAAQVGASGAPALPALPESPGMGMPAAVSSGFSSMGFGTPRSDKIEIDYKGDLKGLLDAATARFGLSWRYRGGAVVVYHLDTRIYKLFNIPSATKMESVTTTGSNVASGSQQGGASGGGGSGGSMSGGSATSMASSTTTISTDAQKDIQDTIKNMLTPSVGRMTFAPSTGTLVVTDTPENLDAIEAYVSNENKFRTTLVLLNVELISMTVSDSNQVGINWNAIYQSLSREYGIGLVSSFSTDSDAISGSINILEGSSRFSGSQLIVNALAKQGNILTRRNPSTSTLNMKPVAVQIANQEYYVDQVTSNQTADVGTSTSASQSSVTAGFNMNMIPYVLPDNQTILLQLTLNISDLLAIQSKEIGDITLESPRLNYQVLNQEVRMQSGETLVLAGLESVSMTSDKSGTGSPRFWLFGGGHSASKKREVLVALITPIVR